MALAGDVLLRYVNDPWRDPAVRHWLRSADVTIVNLESPLSDRGAATPLKYHPDGRLIDNEYLFRAHPRRAKSLTNGGIDAVSLANNHIMDYGPLALDETLQALRAERIAFAGAGRTLAAARRPAIIERNGVRIALLSYMQNGDDMLPGTEYFAAAVSAAGVPFVHIAASGWPDKQSVRMVREDIQAARRVADAVLVAYHWGRERRSRPSNFQRQLGRRTIEAGADAVIGHHPHCLQGIEIYHGKPIFYSLGNFVFRSFDTLTRSTGVVHLTFDGQGPRRITFFPAMIRTVRPYAVKGRQARRIATRLHNLSRELDAPTELYWQGGRHVLRWERGSTSAASERTPTASGSTPARATGKAALGKAATPKPSAENPPAADSPRRASDWVEISRVVPHIVIDLPYASRRNAFQQQLYPANRAFLRWGVAQKLRRAQQLLEPQGLRLKVWDAYRPLGVQRVMWQSVSDRRYVANPRTGSHHNRGAAVDVTLVDRQGQELPMPTGYDDFSQRAHLSYRHPSAEVRRRRFYLQQAMRRAGFQPLATEWWHFDDANARAYPLADVPLEELSG